MANCEIQELDKTIKYLKKNLEQIKLTNINNNIRNNNYKKVFCCQCGCMVNDYDNTEFDINKLIEDNKTLYNINKNLKHKLDEISSNLNKSNNEVN